MFWGVGGAVAIHAITAADGVRAKTELDRMEIGEGDGSCGSGRKAGCLLCGATRRYWR
jgi:hypothetical protein